MQGGGGGNALHAAFFRAYGDGLASYPTVVADVWRLLLRAWDQVRGGIVVPLLRAAVVACAVMSVIVIAEKVFLGTVSLVVKMLRWRPERMYRCDPIVQQDKEAGSAGFPMVLVQIPMYNEKEVYQLSIGAACRLTWPADRLIVQVLDDSTDPIIKELVRNECEKWAKEGINIRYETRKDRAGYKAGNLREGMKHGYVQTCEFVAMFDADFQPAPDFLVKTVPFLVHNPRLALVQTRWKFEDGGPMWKFFRRDTAADEVAAATGDVRAANPIPTHLAMPPVNRPPRWPVRCPNALRKARHLQETPSPATEQPRVYKRNRRRPTDATLDKGYELGLSPCRHVVGDRPRLHLYRSTAST